MNRKTGFRRTGNKYNARKVQRDGHAFDSQLEAEYWDILQILKKTGSILDVQHHPPAVKFECGIGWRIDYLVTNYQGEEYYVEVKGLATTDYKLKLALYKHEFDTPLFVVARSRGTRTGDMKFTQIDGHNRDSIDAVPVTVYL
ncbi:MAG: DUF1064 domain-containing protein [Planctomycetes bacterium]|nr:DUF1064 domain-containing protein [Planctomycetota bacterium]